MTPKQKVKDMQESDRFLPMGPHGRSLEIPGGRAGRGTLKLKI